mmetsp:Transcript_11328/g.43735  ORF Transcript_11328/g.43735 Transcript_11328/m.43735 type:complete len:354 (+) Transcript_11328:746-1807(+)
MEEVPPRCRARGRLPRAGPRQQAAVIGVGALPSAPCISQALFSHVNTLATQSHWQLAPMSPLSRASSHGCFPPPSPVLPAHARTHASTSTAHRRAPTNTLGDQTERPAPMSLTTTAPCSCACRSSCVPASADCSTRDHSSAETLVSGSRSGSLAPDSPEYPALTASSAAIRSRSESSRLRRTRAARAATSALGLSSARPPATNRSCPHGRRHPLATASDDGRSGAGGTLPLEVVSPPAKGRPLAAASSAAESKAASALESSCMYAENALRIVTVREKSGRDGGLRSLQPRRDAAPAPTAAAASAAPAEPSPEPPATACSTSTRSGPASPRTYGSRSERRQTRVRSSAASPSSK